MRHRTCGTCPDPNPRNFCKNADKILRMTTETGTYCELQGGTERRECGMTECLPHNNYHWRDENGKRNWYRVQGWKTHPDNSAMTEKQYIGGCFHFERDTFLKLSLDSDDLKYENRSGLKNRGAFAECMRICSHQYKARHHNPPPYRFKK